MRAMRLAFCLVCCSVCSMPLFGDAVTSGSIQVVGSTPSGRFTLSGSNFVATGSFIFGVWGPTGCLPCSDGFVLLVAGGVTGGDFGGGSAIIDGIPFANVLWGQANSRGSSGFFANGPGIVVNHGAGIYFGTFSFTGSLCGLTDNFSPECAVELPNLSGSGRVAVELVESVDKLWFKQATYTFLPVPEPGSLLLFGSGVLGLAKLVRCKIAL